MANSTAGLIGGLYSVEFARKLDGAADPLPAFAANGGDAGALMAVPVARGWPARARVLGALAGQPVGNLLYPLAHGPAIMPTGETGYFVICPAPPGPSLQAALHPWPETDLIEQVVKPVSVALAALQAQGVTHRAVRPGNLFQSARGLPVTLGQAWAAPPGCHQASWLEPPYSATCLPTARGDGMIADDVYALGAVLLMLAVGANPVAGVPDDELIYRKLDLGSYAALSGAHKLPASLAELIRTMLADDPDHRPSPALLATPAAARARRIASRPTRRSQRSLELAGHPHFTARTLAHTLRTEPKVGLTALRNGNITTWLKRGLGDLVAAAQLDDAIRNRDAKSNGGDDRADPVLIAHVIAILDVFAPLVWRGTALWPDGLGPALDHALHHARDETPLFTELLTTDVIEGWMKRRSAGRESLPGRPASYELRNLLSGERTNGKPVQLSYSLNPLIPCESPFIKRFWATRLLDVLPAMEAAAASAPPEGETLIDSHIAAFIAARRDDRAHGDIGRLAATLPPNSILAQLQLMARMQLKLHAEAVPHLCGWVANLMQPLIQKYRSKTRRTHVAAEVATLTKAGQLPPIVMLLEDEEALVIDARDCSVAAARLAEIEHSLKVLEADAVRQAYNARRIGQDVAGGLGVIASIIALAYAVYA